MHMPPFSDHHTSLPYPRLRFFHDETARCRYAQFHSQFPSGAAPGHKGCAAGSHLPATDNSPSPVCAPQRIRRNKSRTSAYPATSPASARDFCAYRLRRFHLRPRRRSPFLDGIQTSQAHGKCLSCPGLRPAREKSGRPQALRRFHTAAHQNPRGTHRRRSPPRALPCVLRATPRPPVLPFPESTRHR